MNEYENGIWPVYVDDMEALSYPHKRYAEVLGTYEVRFYDNGGMSLLARCKTADEAIDRAREFEIELEAGRLLTPDDSIELCIDCGDELKTLEDIQTGHHILP